MMDSASMDHYEKQLYTVFKTFDVGNEEALDRSAVLDLCDALQLEDRGTALADTLFERPQGRVTFTQFRNGLLSVLGGGPPQSSAPPAAPTAPASDDDSSGREVAPKLVVGAKKYGRRSRPPSASPRPRSRSPDATVESEDDHLRRRMKCKRSSLSMDAEDPETSGGGGEGGGGEGPSLEHDRRVDSSQALELCRALDMDVERVLVRRVFDDAAAVHLSVGEFFDRLNASLSESVAGASVSSDSVALPAAAVVEAWERPGAGVQHARRLLRELGFTAPLVRTGDLARALDEELQAAATGAGDAPEQLYAAALALQRLRASRAEQRADASRAEANKLRGDLAAADRRAQALALEVDENHARLEATLQTRLRQLETRHAEELRARQAELQVERERAAGEREREGARHAAEEGRLRAEAAAAGERERTAEARARAAEERAAHAEAQRERAAATREATPAPAPAFAPLARYDEDEDEVAETAAALALLQSENKRLRDRVDELAVELECVGRGAGAGAVRGAAEGEAGAGGASWREEVAAHPRHHSLVSLNSATNYTDDCDHSLISIDHRMFGHIELVRRLQCLLETVPQVSLTNVGCESCGTLKGIITSIQERIQELSDSLVLADQSGLKIDTSSEAGVQTEGVEELETMKKHLSEVESKYAEEKQKLTSLVKDLETSLDQMKMEYDKCEEYWSNKLDEERDIYAQEQKISDERLTELISKITEYEQQFAPKTNSKTLPTIDEKYSLELQFNGLEDEFDKYKKDKETEIEAKNAEIKQLNDRIQALEAPVTNGNGTSSPIEYLWNQGTIQSPFKNRRDYQNPAYASRHVADQSSPDSEREKAVSPICRPAHAVVDRDSDRERDRREPQMINCSDLEGQLRQQAQVVRSTQASGSRCACAALQARCSQLSASLAHRQMCLDAVRQAARSEGSSLRARAAAAETAVSRLQSRLAAADLLVKELYLENCHLTHQPRPL